MQTAPSVRPCASAAQGVRRASSISARPRSCAGHARARDELRIASPGERADRFLCRRRSDVAEVGSVGKVEHCLFRGRDPACGDVGHDSLRIQTLHFSRHEVNSARGSRECRALARNCDSGGRERSRNRPEQTSGSRPHQSHRVAAVVGNGDPERHSLDFRLPILPPAFLGDQHVVAVGKLWRALPCPPDD